MSLGPLNISRPLLIKYQHDNPALEANEAPVKVTLVGCHAPYCFKQLFPGMAIFLAQMDPPHVAGLCLLRAVLLYYVEQ
jgi:hypothetical protein